MIALNGLLWLQIGLIAFFGALAFTGFMRSAGLGDAPDGRSAHSGVIPTSGGVGIIAGLGLALCAMSVMFPPGGFASGLTQVLSVIFAVGLLGLCDDSLTLGPKLKFGIMLILCAAAVWAIGPPTNFPGMERPVPIPYAVGFAGAVLWVFVVTNVVNFMDGVNGMIGVSLGIANFALFGIGLTTGSPTVTLLGGLMFATIAGFLPYNLRRRAEVFCGDVGALVIGFTFAVTILFLLRETPERSLHLIGPLLILPFLIDSLLTLIRRARRRENLLQAHNQHYYQRRSRAGGSHLGVTWLYGFLALICANAAIIGTSRKWFDHPQFFAAILGAGVLAYVMASRDIRD